MSDDESAKIAANFPPIDWTKSVLGRDLWLAWNQLDHSIHIMLCSPPQQMTQAVAEIEESRKAMQWAMRNRDKWWHFW